MIGERPVLLRVDYVGVSLISVNCHKVSIAAAVTMMRIVPVMTMR